MDRKQQQRKRRVQKGLEDNVRRTVYISYIDQQVTSGVCGCCLLCVACCLCHCCTVHVRLCTVDHLADH
jgi:hypothetical protein